MVSASNTFDSCSYYSKLENELQCGNEAYISKFAKPYCETFLNKKKQFSISGQKILRNIRNCLQNTLADKENILNCSNIEFYGFESHYQCYLDNGFCELGHFDLLRLYWIAKKEIFNPQIWKLFIEVEAHCLVQ